MKVIRRSPTKYWIFIGDRAFVLRVRKEMQLIPRWRLASLLAFCSFAAGAGVVSGTVFVGGIMLVLAAFLLWGASR